MGAFIMFDLTNRDSFTAANKLINEVKENATDQCVLILIGNKADRTRNK